MFAKLRQTDPLPGQTVTRLAYDVAPTFDRLPLCCVDLRKRGSQAARQLVHVVVGPEVHEEQPRLVIEHMVVNRGDLDAVVAQRLHYGVDFLRNQYEVARDCGLASPGGLKVDGVRRTHCLMHIHPAMLDLLRTRDTDLVDAATDLALVA